MLQLAMIAALLMALVPSLIRIGGHANSGPDRTTPMASMSGMHPMHGHAGMMGEAGHAMPSHGDGGHVDCAYCPLLASLAMLAMVLLVLPALPAPGWIFSRRRCAPSVAIRHPCGLGSRGPPVSA